MSVQRAATALMCVAALAAAASPASAATRGKPHAGGRVHQTHRVRTVSFTAQVVRASAKGLVIRTAKGRVLSFAAAQIKPAAMPRKHRISTAHARMRTDDLQLSTGNVVISLLGLQPGVTIQVTEVTDAQGNITITITLPGAMGQQSTSGIVTEVDGDAFTLQTADGRELRLHVSGDTLSNLNLQPCDQVAVIYHQDAGILVADRVNSTGTSTDGSCAPTYDDTGTITQVSPDSVTINTDHGTRTYAVDPSAGLTDGYQVGDLVDVTYTINSDGSRSADDVQFVESEATGQVTSVTTSTRGGSLSITDDNTGQSEEFSADPARGVQINAHAFNGLSVGDSVDITYHQSAAGLIADTVSER